MTGAVGVAPLKVLLVDDDEDQYLLTRELLVDDLGWHFDLDWAPTFEDGVRQFSRSAYDVALIDYNLGAQNGVELLRTRAVRDAGVPAIMLTGESSARVDDDARSAGAVDFLVKTEVTAPMLKRALRYAVERHRVLSLLKQQEQSLRALLEDSADVIVLTDREGRILFASDSVRQVDGCPSGDLMGRSFFDGIHPAERERVRRAFEQCVAQGGRVAADYRQEHRDWSWRHREVSFVNRLSQPGILAVVATYRDVTERKRAEAEQAHFAAIIRSSDDAIFSHSLAGAIISWNRSAERLYGFRAQEMIGRHISTLLPLSDDGHLPDWLERTRHGEATRYPDIGCLRRDGTLVSVSLNISPLLDRDGRIVGGSVIAHDITERKRAESALIEREAEYRSSFDDAPVGMAQTDLAGRCRRVNVQLASMLGYRQEQLSELSVGALTHPDDLPRDLAAIEDMLCGRRAQYTAEKRYRRADGGYLWVQITVSLHHDGQGRPKHFIVVVQDISERKQAQDEVAHIFKLSPDMICANSFDGYFTRTNDAWATTLGYTPEEVQKVPFISFVHPEDRESTLAVRSRVMSGETVLGFTNRYRAADGSYRWLEWHSIADRDARVIYAVARDQTERRQLEQQLRQAQKMEAVGRLAGGIAHDFNNLLTAIIGFSELSMMQAPEGANRDDIAHVLEAAHSAAALTRQLLAFSRKQVLSPEVFDVNGLLEKTRTLLTRVIGEDVRLVTRLTESDARICADRSQIEQVIMNLAVNARDAMPAGGELTLETAAIELDEAFTSMHPGAVPGPHVRITVSDTGSGMTAEVLAHVFEPFFTTKEPGKGTGLGLATVYGIIKQSGGYVTVDSTVGRGTSFALYLPHASADAGMAPVAAGATARGGEETILLVEDQIEVRGAVRQMLERCGYNVWVAADGEAALALMRASDQRIGLLLTDVVMPQMNGRELADRVTAGDPGVRVLFMSGYTEDAIVRHGVLEPGINLIQKPFTRDQLLARIRDVLDRPRPGE